MSRATELPREQATPLPWTDPEVLLGWSIQASINRFVALYAVNRMPDYEAAVEALETVIRAMERRGPSEGHYCAWSDEEHQTVEDARAALARLREQVPA